MDPICPQTLVLKSYATCQFCSNAPTTELTSPFNRTFGCMLCTACATQYSTAIYKAFGAAHPCYLPTSALQHPNTPVSVVRTSGKIDPGWLPISEAEYRAFDPGTTAPIVFAKNEIKFLMRHITAGHVKLCNAVDLLRVNPTWAVTLNPPHWANVPEWEKQWVACVLAAGNVT